MRYLCSSISFFRSRKRASFCYFSLFNSALNFSTSGLLRSFLGASGTLVYKVIYFLFQSNFGLSVLSGLSRLGFFYLSSWGFSDWPF